MKARPSPRTIVDVVTAGALRLALARDRLGRQDGGPEQLVDLARGDALTLVRSLHRIEAAQADRPSRVGDTARHLLEMALAQVQSTDGRADLTG